MTKEQNYTSTGEKILAHPEVVQDIGAGQNHPVVLHIMPTERCNLACSFCSVADRGINSKLHPDLHLSQALHVVYSLIHMGLKAVILSGGGEPTLYCHINTLLYRLFTCGLEVGLITNGTEFTRRIVNEFWEQFTWIRISANTYDYRDDIDIPQFASPTLGFSYIVNDRTTRKTLNKIKEVAIEKAAKYVRLLPDCNLPTEELEKQHKTIKNLVLELGDPFFHQYKTHRRPAECYLGRVHPVLYCDGQIYPCDSVVLNMPFGQKTFHKQYAICSWDKVGEFYSTRFTPYDGSLVDTSMCPKCVFAHQNDLLTRIVNGQVTVADKPAGKLEHINFL